ncbi:unnamed protein product [Anisakis simplex]|uniref:Uncharacterized protein n=1 Tax=Anisakis simplex TaxID=6269 RepID=A0A0M3JUE3_ANISI|nr:unnamed protein product [Anisakis simplex]
MQQLLLIILCMLIVRIDACGCGGCNYASDLACARCCTAYVKRDSSSVSLLPSPSDISSYAPQPSSNVNFNPSSSSVQSSNGYSAPSNAPLSFYNNIQNLYSPRFSQYSDLKHNGNSENINNIGSVVNLENAATPLFSSAISAIDLIKKADLWRHLMYGQAYRRREINEKKLDLKSISAKFRDIQREKERQKIIDEEVSPNDRMYRSDRVTNSAQSQFSTLEAILQQLRIGN